LANKFESGRAKGENSLFINGRIRDELTKYQTTYLLLGSIAEKLTVKELKERLISSNHVQEIDFLKFADDYLEELKNQGKEGSARGFRGLITHFKKFKAKINFSDIDLAFLISFQDYLKKEGVGNGVNNYMRYFRLLFNRARDLYNDEDRVILKIPQYPFRKLKIEKPERATKENRLTVNEMKLFINYKPDRERMQMAKDMFLLMFYLIGINTKDLYNLKKPDKTGRVYYKRAKTNRDYSIKLEPEALEIINRYKGKEKLLNLNERYGYYLDWQKYTNIELKNIGKKITTELKKENPKASFPENMTTNWARHTWATIARNDCRINKDDVALCLGHEDTDNKVTDIYINYDYRIIDESNRKVLDMIKS
jgi:integrase